MPSTIDGSLIVQPAKKASESGVAYYVKWRDSTRTQVKRKLGPAWVERHGDGWRKRRGACPRGYLVPNAAADRMRDVIDAHEVELSLLRSDGLTGVGIGGVLTFEYVAEAWLRHGKSVAGWKPSTAMHRRSVLNAHLLPAFGKKAIREISTDQVRRWWRGLHDDERDGGRLADRNANKILADFRAIWNWGADEYELPPNPSAGIKKHKELTSERPDFYSPEEVHALLDAAGTERDRLIYLVAAFAGLRRGEVISLRWSHIDFERAYMHVVESVSAGQDSRVKDEEGRSVPLAPQVALALGAWKPDDAQPNDLLFQAQRYKKGRGKKKLDGDALSTRYREARDRAGLRKLRFHDLRHTFGSLAVDGGASLVQVQAWMGHADIKTTMRYLHTKSRPEDAALLGSAFAVRPPG